MTKNSSKTCLYPTCTRQRHKRFWCNSHYIQQRRNGFESMWSSTPPLICVYRECDRKPFSRGLCNKHYKYIHNGEVPVNPDRIVNLKLDSCSVVNCEDKTRRSLMCSKHEALCRKYNISNIQLSGMLIHQDFSCKICGDRDKKLFIDHDHKCCHDDSDPRHYKRCGECNRGLICSGCNFGLAAFDDNIETIRRASEYFDSVIDTSFIEDSMGADEEGSRTWESRWYRYGIGPKRLDFLMSHLDNKCPICNNDFEEVHLDHCHKTNKFRMPLCRDCNHGLGHAKDSSDILLAMIQYLEEYKNGRDVHAGL